MIASQEVEHENLRLGLTADLATHETEMTWRIVGTAIASAGVILAAIGVFRRHAGRPQKEDPRDADQSAG